MQNRGPCKKTPDGAKMPRRVVYLLWQEEKNFCQKGEIHMKKQVLIADADGSFRVINAAFK
jgi:hypothetical protein